MGKGIHREENNLTSLITRIMGEGIYREECNLTSLLTRIMGKSEQREEQLPNKNYGGVGASHGNLPHVKNFSDQVTLMQIGIQATAR
jgi:hypothetical protein